MGLFNRSSKNIDVPPTLTEEEKQYNICLEAFEKHQQFVHDLSDYFVAISKTNNEFFELNNYYIWSEGSTINFMPQLSYEFGRYNIKKKIEEVGVQGYCDYINNIKPIKYEVSEIKATVLDEGKLTSNEITQEEQKYALMSEIKVHPLLIALTFPEEMGFVTNTFEFKNELIVIEFLNSNFNDLHLMNYYNVLDMPEKICIVTPVNNDDLIPSNDLDVWRTENDINFSMLQQAYNNNKKLFYAKLPLEIIEYYRIEGDISYEDRISGGGGGGSDYGKALIGGLLFGATGAIVASRNEINDIQSERLEHDRRCTVLSLLIENERKKAFFDVKSMEVFNKLIPEKFFDTLSMKKTSEQAYKADESSIVDQIAKLAELYEKGILTEEEFREGKKALLAKLAL